MHIDEIKKSWLSLSHRNAVDTTLAVKTLKRILRQYNALGRHYHNTIHLSDLICFQQEYAPLIIDNDSLLYAIFFHDIIYNITRKDNEIRSAEEAAGFLRSITYPDDKILKVYRYISATAGHSNEQGDPDLDYFLDFDLHILGAMPDQYDLYTRQIRREYALYPGFMYRKGRKKVLQHFLSKPAIYRTQAFREKYELKARENMERELDAL